MSQILYFVVLRYTFFKTTLHQYEMKEHFKNSASLTKVGAVPVIRLSFSRDIVLADI